MTRDTDVVVRDLERRLMKINARLARFPNIEADLEVLERRVMVLSTRLDVFTEVNHYLVNHGVPEHKLNEFTVAWRWASDNWADDTWIARRSRTVDQWLGIIVDSYRADRAKRPVRAAEGEGQYPRVEMDRKSRERAVRR